MTNAQYHGSAGYSKSHLDDVAVCPLNYWAKRVDPEREAKESTPAMIVGQAIHTAILEPDLFSTDWLIMPEFNNRSTAGRALRDEWLATEGKGKQVLTVDQRDTALAAAAAVHKHPVASRLLRGGKAEQTYFTVDPRTGELIKCRLDFFNEAAGLIVDVKSTDDASPDSFGKSVANFRYHVQEAFYEHVMRTEFGEAPPFWAFLAVEKTPPYLVGIYYLEEEDVARGARLAKRDLDTIINCKKRAVWPDYATEAKVLKLPGWYRAQCDRTLNDEPT